MASSSAAPPPAFGWTRRVYDAVPLAPGWVGVSLAAALFGLFLLVELILGRQPIRFEGNLLADPSGESLITLLLCILLAYLCTASISAAREAPRAVRRVRHLLRGSEAELDALEAEAERRPRAVLWVGGLLGTGIALLFPLLEADMPWPVYDWRHWTPESTWHRFLAPLIGWWMGRLIGVMLIDSLRYSRLARRIATIDLLDPRPLEPFVRFGLANALRVTGFVALFAFLLIDLARYGVAVLFIASLTVAAASAALVLPLRGAHQRIREAKQAELDAVDSAIRGDARALRASALAGRSEVPSLADLVAWRELVVSAREWPFDASTFLRFSLYLMIPLGSWLGGAFVERLVDAALG